MNEKHHNWKAQRYFDTITHYEDDWKIKINGDKTKFMFIGSPDTILQNESLFITHTTRTCTPLGSDSIQYLTSHFLSPL